MIDNRYVLKKYFLALSRVTFLILTTAISTTSAYTMRLSSHRNLQMNVLQRKSRLRRRRSSSLTAVIVLNQ